MSKLIIKGEKKLEGEIEIKGSKNAALALIPATLLIEGEVILKNVPIINDVQVIIEIMKYLGSKINFEKNTLFIDNRDVYYKDLIIPEVKMLRGSILFLGPVLSKFKNIKIYFPGGDLIGARPIDTHIKALNDLGANLTINDSIIEGNFDKFLNNRIILKEISVTASENLITFACNSPKPIQLRLVAIEPSVQSLCLFLRKAGYEIRGIGSHFLTVKKGKKIKKEITFTVPPDPIESATFLSLALATKSKLIIKNNKIDELDSLIITLKEMKANFRIKNNDIYVYESNLKSTKIQTGLYPKLATDFQPVLGTLATQANGVTFIHEWMYENRLSYLKELALMGANVEILDPHRAIVIGPTPLIGKEIKALDIRHGAALIIAGLIAKGETIIHEAEIIDRGYENIVERLKNIGADIKKED
jgi:UDP-N-acetylglucosamine 1-carboxyvinyltransferase